MFGVNALQVKPVANGGRYKPTFSLYIGGLNNEKTVSFRRYGVDAD